MGSGKTVLAERGWTTFEISKQAKAGRPCHGSPLRGYMTEYTVKLWGPNQPGGKIHSYPTNTEDGFVAAAEALAHFRQLDEGPVITLDSRIEIDWHDANRADSIFPVKSIFRYLSTDPAVLSGLEESDVNVLKALAEELDV